MKDKKLFEMLAKELLKHGVVKITGLGVFRLKKVEALTRYIPGSKKVGKIQAHVRISFKPTISLKRKFQTWK